MGFNQSENQKVCNFKIDAKKNKCGIVNSETIYCKKDYKCLLQQSNVKAGTCTKVKVLEKYSTIFVCGVYNDKTWYCPKNYYCLKNKVNWGLCQNTPINDSSNELRLYSNIANPNNKECGEINGKHYYCPDNLECLAKAIGDKKGSCIPELRKYSNKLDQKLCDQQSACKNISIIQDVKNENCGIKFVGKNRFTKYCPLPYFCDKNTKCITEEAYKKEQAKNVTNKNQVFSYSYLSKNPCKKTALDKLMNSDTKKYIETISQNCTQECCGSKECSTSAYFSKRKCIYNCFYIKYWKKEIKSVFENFCKLETCLFYKKDCNSSASKQKLKECFKKRRFYMSKFISKKLQNIEWGVDNYLD